MHVVHSLKLVVLLVCIILSSGSLLGCQSFEFTPPSEPISGTDTGMDNQTKGNAVPIQTDVGWKRYENSEFRFSVSYPDNYVILAESKRPEENEPSLVFRMRFQDRDLAKSETADLQVPMATVEIYEKSSAISLEIWLDTEGESGSRSSIAVGQLGGYEIVSPLLMAPNRFLYFASDTHIYKLTLLGPFAEGIMQSFDIN